MQVAAGSAEISDVDSFMAELDQIGSASGCVVQAFDARYIAGEDHLQAAVEHARRAAERDDMIASDLAIEILCYAAGRRQISRALTIGVSAGADPVPVVIVIDGDREVEAQSRVTDLVNTVSAVGANRDCELIREFFEIPQPEIDATDASLEDLVIERVALLVVEK